MFSAPAHVKPHCCAACLTASDLAYLLPAEDARRRGEALAGTVVTYTIIVNPERPAMARRTAFNNTTLLNYQFGTAHEVAQFVTNAGGRSGD